MVTSTCLHISVFNWSVLSHASLSNLMTLDVEKSSDSFLFCFSKAHMPLLLNYNLHKVLLGCENSKKQKAFFFPLLFGRAQKQRHSDTLNTDS